MLIKSGLSSNPKIENVLSRRRIFIDMHFPDVRQLQFHVHSILYIMKFVGCLSDCSIQSKTRLRNRPHHAGEHN